MSVTEGCCWSVDNLLGVATWTALLLFFKQLLPGTAFGECNAFGEWAMMLLAAG